MRPSERLAERSAKRHRNVLYCRIDLWGFVAIFVALLFLFFPPSSHSDRRFPAVNLPVSRSAVRVPAADREDALTVSIDREGRIFFGTYQVYGNDLASVLRENMTNEVERRVIIRADSRAMYRDVEVALDAVKKVRIENITIVTSRSPDETFR